MRGVGWEGGRVLEGAECAREAMWGTCARLVWPSLADENSECQRAAVSCKLCVLAHLWLRYRSGVQETTA